MLATSHMLVLLLRAQPSVLQKAGIDAYMEAYTTFYNENK